MPTTATPVITILPIDPGGLSGAMTTATARHIRLRINPAICIFLLIRGLIFFRLPVPVARVPAGRQYR